MNNYEEKYKAALERAIKLSIDGYLDAIAIDDIFPELKESEDERIRKELIDFVENWKIFNPDSALDDYAIYTSDSGECDKILAWLEKQAEQKPIFNADDWYVSKVDGKIHNAKFIEKQGVQKSIEPLKLSDIDKAMVESRIVEDLLIMRACEWLDCYIDNYLFIDAENKSGIKWDDFINDFRKAMKGGEW